MKPYLFSIAILIFSSCARTYYVSPMYGNSTPYHTLPLQKDSVKNNLYASASILAGGANYNLNDDVHALHLNLYNVNRFSLLKLWYGGGFSFGDYVVRTIDPTLSSGDYINSHTGGKFFGSLNGNVGIDLSLPLNDKTEWRVLGIELSAQKEYGDYLNFRQQLVKDSIYVTGIAASNFLCTTGISTEFAFVTGKGVFSVSAQYNILAGKDYKHKDYSNTSSWGSPSFGKRYTYFGTTCAYTIKNLTAFLQFNTGTRMCNVQTGINYRLSKR